MDREKWAHDGFKFYALHLRVLSMLNMNSPKKKKRKNEKRFINLNN